MDDTADTGGGHYESLLKSTNYVTRRQSLKLLGELLLDRSNFNVMMQVRTTRARIVHAHRTSPQQSNGATSLSRETHSVHQIAHRAIRRP